MARVKGAMMTRKRRNKVLKLAKSYWGSKSTHFKMAKQAVIKSGKVKMGHCHHRHNTGLKTAKRKRHLRQGAILSDAMTANIKALIQK